MAGHSHWAGIKHKKGRQDSARAKTFSKLSREITVAAKLGAKDPDSNPRLRTAIQAAKQSNMPKDNIMRAITKSEINLNETFQSLRYEGFGPHNVALIIETLTDNKNRTASNLRTILQKNGGTLGENGCTSYLFFNCGVIQFKKEKLSNDEVMDLAINLSAKDFNSKMDYHEILTEKEHFYKVKSAIEKKIPDLLYFGIEWRARSYIDLSKEKQEQISSLLVSLEQDDDVQKIFINSKI